jgi:hypothetical protein
VYVSPTSTLSNISFLPVASASPALPVERAAVSAYSQQDVWTPSFTGDNTIQAQGKNVGLRIIGKTLGLQSDYIEASFHDKTPDTPIDIENLDFNLHIKSGVASVSDVDATLTIERMLNRKTQGTNKKPPVEDLRVTFNPNNEVRVEGKVRALGFKIPIDIKGQIATTATGEIRYDLGKAKIAGIGVNGLMSVAGLSLDKLLKLHNPNEGYYTQNNSLYLNLGKTVSQLEDAIGLQATVRDVSTHLGRLQLVIGDTPEDAARALREKQIKEPAYVKSAAGHAYIDGFFVKNGKINIYDQTPDTPLLLNFKGPEKNIQVKSGLVGITDARFEELIKDEIGDTDAFVEIDTNLEKDGAHLKGKLFGAIPVSMNLKFDRTQEGQLMFTPNSPKALGFIPLPVGMVRSKVQKLIKTGVPYGDGVVIKMGGIDLGYISQLAHQNGYIVMESSEKPQQN